MKECGICYEEKEAHVQCPSCEKEVCADCFQKEMLMEYREPRCMMCKNMFSIEWIIESQPKEWIQKEFWPFWGRWRMEREMQLLPEDEEDARNLLRVRALRERIRALPLLKRLKSRKQSEEAVNEVRREKQELQDQIRWLSRGNDEDYQGQKRVKKAVIGFCPWEGCHGFLRVGSNQCGLCHRRSCNECGMIEKDAERHECDPDQRESYRMIRKETKPCPGCSAPIFFIGGCDQMWCTACHTLFSWQSGEAIEERIHNPHYYEWVRRQQQQQEEDNTPPPIMELDGNDIPCFSMYSGFLIRRELDYQLFSDLHMTMTHLRGAVLPMLQPHIPDIRDLRLLYLIGDLTKEQWAHRLEYREKKRLKWTSLHNLAVTNLAVMRDLIRLSIIRPDDPPTREDVAKIKDFALDRIETILRCYGGSRHHPALKWVQRI